MKLLLRKYHNNRDSGPARDRVYHCSGSNGQQGELGITALSWVEDGLTKRDELCGEGTDRHQGPGCSHTLGTAEDQAAAESAAPRIHMFV